jgi:hypothetical protein
MLLVAPLATLQLAAQPSLPINFAAATMPGISESSDEGARADDHERRSHSSSHSLTSGDDPATCADYDHDFDTKSMVHSEQALSFAGNRLDVTGAKNGGINVRRATGNAFGITVCKHAGGVSTAEANQVLSQLNVQERGGKLTASGPEDESWSIDFIITVPDNRSISLVGENGPISVGDVNGNIDAQVENGPLSFRGSRGEIKAKAQNGPLSLSRVSGNVDASTENGPLSVSLDGTAWVGGELRARVHNGPLSLSMPSAYQTGVSVSASGHAPFSCKGDICRGVGERDYNDHTPLKANLGNGPTRIYLEGGNGPVSLNEKE